MKKCVKLLSSFLIVMLIVVTTLSPISASAQSYMRGVDVSEHNVNTDFALLKSQGYDFAMIKLGYYNHLDPTFYENVKAACDAGMVFGVYLYSYAFSDYEAQVEADFVINTLATLDPAYKAKMLLPVAYDLEDKKILDNNCGKNEITNHALIFSNTLKAAGYTPMVYANDYWFKNYIDMNTLYQNDVKIWYAYWTNDSNNLVTNVKDTNIPCFMWQYTENGIDQNIVYFDYSFVPVALNEGNTSVKLNKSKYTYDGKAKKPSVTVYDQYGNVIPNSFYSLTYSNNVKPGKAKIKINFHGDYTGSTYAAYTIIPKKQTISSVKSTSRKKLKVAWKKDKTVSGYQVQYSTSKKFYKSKSKTVTVSKKNTSKTISNLKSKKNYYVRVRAYKTIDGEKVYSSWSKTKSVKVK